jgi:cytochrome c oxidase assembly protein subunit 15
VIMMSERLRRLTLSTVILLFATIVMGGYVSQIGAGLACPDWPLCPLSTDPFIVAEFTHRIVAIAAFFSALATFITALRLSSNRVSTARRLLTTGFILLIIQVFLLGSSVIFSSLEPVLVTAHLAVAVTVFALFLTAYFNIVWTSER